MDHFDTHTTLQHKVRSSHDARLTTTLYTGGVAPGLASGGASLFAVDDEKAGLVCEPMNG